MHCCVRQYDPQLLTHCLLFTLLPVEVIDYGIIAVKLYKILLGFLNPPESSGY